MPVIDRPGIFKVASCAELGIKKSKIENSLAIAAVIKFTITEMWNGKEWVEWNYAQHVYAQLWFIGKTGQLKDNAVDTLRDVLGWDGDPDSLTDGTLQTPECKVEVKNEPYEKDGITKNSFKVDRIYRLDSSGSGIKSVAPDVLVKIKAMYGNRLKAACQKQPSSPPGSPVSPPQSPPSTSIQTYPDSDKNGAWAAFKARQQESGPPIEDDELDATWHRALSELIPGKLEEEFTPTDWGIIKHEGPGLVIPF